jgi:hypothetical protein
MVYYPTLFFDCYDEFAFYKDYSGFIHKISEYNKDNLICFGKILIDITESMNFSIECLLENIYHNLPSCISDKEFIFIDSSHLIFKYNSFYFLLNWTISDSMCSIGVIIGRKFINSDKGLYILYDDEDEAATVVANDFNDYDSDFELDVN